MSAVKLSDNFYDEIKPRLYHRVSRELRSAYCVLDLGCGDCELVKYLAETYGHKVTGIDISSASFPSERKTNKNWPLARCIRKDAAKLDSIQDKTVDAVVMFWSLHEMSNPQAVLKEIRRVLQLAGKVLIVEFPRNSLAQKLWNENYYSKQGLINYLHKAGFKEIQARLLEHKQILWVSGYRSSKRTNSSEIINVKTYET